MKPNLNVTDSEREFDAGDILILETDAEGIIVYANTVFFSVSGYGYEEIIGHHYELTRHPDMPDGVYTDLWRTVNSGMEWSGIIKNCTSNGDFYWVKESIIPIYKGSNQVVGYRSMSRKPSRQEVDATESIYKRSNLGESIVFNTLADRRSKVGVVGHLSLGCRLWVPVILSVLACLSVTAMAVLGVDSKFILIFAGTLCGLSLVLTAWFSIGTQQAIKKLLDGVRLFDRGVLSSRIDYYGTDELGVLARLFNRSADMVESSLNEIVQTTKAVSEGDFSHSIDLNMEGDFQRVKDSINMIIANLIDIFTCLRHQIKAISEGDFSDINDINKGSGEYKSIFDYILQVQTSRKQSLFDMIGHVDAVANGDFSGRMSEIDCYGDNKLLLQQINRLFQLVEENLSDISRITNCLAQGDLTKEIDNHYPGLFGETAMGVNKMRQSLIQMIKVMADSINVIHTASLQISNGNMDFAQRTEVQSVSLKKNAASMENLLSKVKQTADTAKLANQLVLDTSEIAVQGGAAVGEVVNTMITIDQSSRKVANIIGVIDEIAFQTNILALNAAVEAARAGEQGRGFAVVASEVRSLAQRSAAAAKEIKNLIQVSVANVEAGNARVEDAGTTINEVVSYVNRVTDLMADISLASSDQSAGIDQVKDVISQINCITEMNNILAAESIEAASILEKQSRYLREIIAKFSCDDYEVDSFVASENIETQNIAAQFELF